MKKIVFAIVFLTNALFVKAQYNSLDLYNPHFSFNKSSLIPSKLGLNTARFEMRIIPNVYAYQANTLMSIKDIMYPSTQAIGDALGGIDQSQIIAFGAEIPGLAFSYKINKDKKELLTLSLSNKTRVLNNTLLGANLLRLLWDGNKQFEGQTVELGNIGASAIGATEIALGWAMPFVIAEKYKIRAGASFKYFLSPGGGYLPETNSNFTTTSGGKSISLSDVNYIVQTSTADENTLFPGKGMGMDLSVSMDFMEDFTASLAVLDIGSITYSANTYSFQYAGEIYYQGIEDDNIFINDETKEYSIIDTDNWITEDSNQTFSISLPTRMVVQVEKNIMSETNKNEREYIKHGMYFTYIQGFSNVAGTTNRPYFSGGYSYSLDGILNVGPTMNYGGYAGFGLGMFLSVKVGAFRIGAGSNTVLSYLIMPGMTKSVDASFMTCWSIGNGKVKKTSASID